MPGQEGAPVQGQGSPTPPASTGQGAAPDTGSGQGFYGYKDHTGKDWNFSSREDWDKHYKEVIAPERMMRADHTRKTQEIAELRRQHEAERLRFENDRKSFQQEREAAKAELEKAKQYSEFLRLHPEVRQDLDAKIKRGLGPEGVKEQMKQLLKEEYGEDLDFVQQQRKEREREAREKEAVAALKLEIPDFDETHIIPKIRKLIDEGAVEDLMRMAYFAHKGEVPQSQIVQQVAEGMASKQSASISPTGSPARSGGNTYANTEEWAEAMKNRK